MGAAPALGLPLLSPPAHAVSRQPHAARLRCAYIRSRDGLRVLRLRGDQGRHRRCVCPSCHTGGRRRRVRHGSLHRRNAAPASLRVATQFAARRAHRVATASASIRHLCRDLPRRRIPDLPQAFPGAGIAGAMEPAPGGSAWQPGIAPVARGGPGAGRAAHLRILPRPSRQPDQRPIPFRSRLDAFSQQHRALCRLRQFFAAGVVRSGGARKPRPGGPRAWFARERAERTPDPGLRSPRLPASRAGSPPARASCIQLHAPGRRRNLSHRDRGQLRGHRSL